MKRKIYLSLALVALGLASCQDSEAPAASVEPAANATANSEATEAPADVPARYQVPVIYDQLDNGLKVILSPDSTAPIIAIGVYYNIGFRIEPKDRTGFAHLFEHMMFQGSENLGKMEFVKLIQKNGGVLNGSTRFDFTNYFEILPANKLETVIWAEADRMRGLNITQENLTNQQGVVKNEVKVNVLNQPYGGFPWLDMPQYANENWYNAHNFYGELEDLDAANLEDVKSFFDSYYAPGNAAVAIVGDFEPEEAMALMEKHFGDIKARPTLPLPDISEPRQEKEKRFEKTDALAPKPAVAFAYHMPERNSPEYYAMGLINEILLQGDDSLLHQALVVDNEITGSVNGGINALGNMFNYNGPMLIMGSLRHDPEHNTDGILKIVDQQVQSLMDKPVSQATLERAMTKMRSGLYDTLDGFYGVGRVDLLATFALFDDKPEKINEIEAEFEKVTPELIQKTAKEYLRSTNRTVLSLKPGQASASTD